MSKDKERIEFSAIIGNPPYQVTKGGTKNVDVWQHFVKVANLCGAKWVSMIHPARWVVPKKSMQNNRDEIIDAGLQKFDYFSNSTDLFPSAAIDGGVSITNFKKDYKGDIDYYIEDKKYGKYTKDTRFYANDFEKEIVDKLVSKFDSDMSERVRGSIGSLNSSDFGYNKTNHIKLLKDDKKGMKNPIKIWATTGFGKGGSKFDWHYIEKDKINEIPKEILSTRKVLLDKKGNAGINGGNIINGQFQICEKNSIGQDVFFVLPQNDTDYELKLIQSLFCTKTARFLMSLTQKDLCVRGFENIPDYTYFINDMKDPKYNNKMFENKLGLLTDEYFYKKFNFSQELIDYIESHISPKELV